MQMNGLYTYTSKSDSEKLYRMLENMFKEANLWGW